MTPLLRASLTLGWLAMATAQAGGTRVLSGSLGGTSDFVFRGLSLTRGKPAVQASLDVEFPHEFYVGAFVATADPNPGPSPPVEMDVWAGRYWNIAADFSADLRLSQYAYPDDPRRVTYDRTEVSGTVGYRNQWFLAASFSPNTRAVGSSAGYQEGNAWTVELSGRLPLSERFAVSAGLGHYGLEDVYQDSFEYWNATLSANLAPIELQLAWLGVGSRAERHFVSESTGNRIALTALWRFSTTR